MLCEINCLWVLHTAFLWRIYIPHLLLAYLHNVKNIVTWLLLSDNKVKSTQYYILQQHVFLLCEHIKTSVLYSLLVSGHTNQKQNVDNI